MEKQFAASEVRGQIAWLKNVTVVGTRKTYQMLNAFADLLEAQERAVPVATAEDQLGFPTMEWMGDAGDKYPVGTKLYTHPSPSDAPDEHEAAEAALAVHSAQAQPPAASVTDAMQELADKYHELLWAVARKFPGETRHETALRYIREAECQEAALADQENPNG